MAYDIVPYNNPYPVEPYDEGMETIWESGRKKRRKAKMASGRGRGRPRKTVFKYVGSNIDAITERYKNRIFEGILNSAWGVSRGVEHYINNIYKFKDPSTTDRVIKLKYDVRNQEAIITIINTSLSLTRVRHIPPASHKEPGYTQVEMYGGHQPIKAFPIHFTKGGGAMVTRSGIQGTKHPLAEWQVRQSRMMFTPSPMAGKFIDRSMQEDFETHERAQPRHHTFKVARTENMVTLARQVLPMLLKKVPKNIIVSLGSMPRTLMKRGISRSGWARWRERNNTNRWVD